jgi:hypothetical protein
MARKWQNAGIVALVFPLCAKYPDILPVDIHTGQVRGFGSRLHYDFSSETYVMQAQRITDAMARRYGGHPLSRVGRLIMNCVATTIIRSAFRIS